MQAFHLGLRLGDLNPATFKRYYLHRQLGSLEHDAGIIFDSSPRFEPTVITGSSKSQSEPSTRPIAHKAGTNCIAIDQTQGQYLISGGADTAIKLWDLESPNSVCRPQQYRQDDSLEPYRPVASISKATSNAHTHSITSLSIYPHDPTPQLCLSTSYDSSLLLTQITPTSLTPLHKFPLDGHTTYCHSVQSSSSATPLVAVGTSHPAPRLIDLRTALSTHSLPGHAGSIHSLAWHPTKSHILISSSTAGQILAFDIRRATPAFASFDVDDNLGILHPSANNHTRIHLDYTHRAHSAAITGVSFTHTGDKLISASQDQRLRLWDVATGRNELVHFGPRIRNTRDGEYKAVLAPVGTSNPFGAGGKEVLFWPNDDGRGDIFMHDLREGTLLRVLKTRGVIRDVSVAQRGGRVAKGSQTVHKFTSAGRINGLAFRPVRGHEGLGGSVEMYSAHGDGGIRGWVVGAEPGLDEEEGTEENNGDGEDTTKTQEEIDAERSKKRKRDLIEGLVEGLTKRPVTFS